MAREGSQILREDVSYNPNDVLGTGATAVVFSGMRGNCKVAIKRITNENFNELEVSTMKTLDHPNVLKFYDLIEVEEGPDFKYIALELCDATVENYCAGTYKGKVPPDYQALYQMADGLNHLHSKGYGHRDISTKNVLIKLIDDEAVMKISDFGVCKPSSESGSISMSNNGRKGTIPFCAPELLKQILNNENHDELDEIKKVRGHISNDIFSLGCVFYRFLTKDGHPFMKGAVSEVYILSQIAVNILNNEHCLERLDEKQAFAKSLIIKMIQPDKDQRPQLDEVKQELKSFLNSNQMSNCTPSV